MSTPKPIPTPGPYPGVPDPGVRPVPSPSPQTAPKPAPTTGAKPGVIDGVINGVKDGVDALTPSLPSIPGIGVVSNIGDGITAVRAWISNRHNWTRVAWFAAGSAMFTVGAVMVGERPLSQGVTSVAQPVGKVVKSVYKG